MESNDNLKQARFEEHATVRFLVESLARARPDQDGRDVTRNFAKAFQLSQFYLAERVELEDCSALLR